jgi:hypothetical protein
LGHGAVLLLLSHLRRVVLALGLLLDNLLPQLEELRPSLGEGLYAGEAFTEGSKGGEDHHRIRRDVVRLQIVGVEEVPEEVRHRQTKAPLEVGNEHYAFAGFRCRHYLSRR